MRRLHVILGRAIHALSGAALVLLLASAVPATSVWAQSPTPPQQPPGAAGPAAGPAAAPGEPVVALVRLFLNDILKFDPSTGFTTDIFVGFACNHVCGDLGIVVENGRATSRELLIDTPQIKGYRMELALTDKIDLHQYPFDRHRLSIGLLSARPGEEFQFVVERENTMVGDIKLQGWQIDQNWQAETWVIPEDQFAARSIPAYRFSVLVSRPWLAGLLKVILPGFAIVVVGSLGLIVGPEERIKRFDLFNAAFLGTVLFQLNVLSSLPPLSYLTFADRFLLINLVSIIIGVASSVWIIMAFRAGRKAHSWAIHEWSMLVIPLVWLSAQSLNAMNVFGVEANDPRLWLVGGVELVVSMAILVWHSRRMTLGTRFRDAYRRGFEQTRAPDQALNQAIDTFANEPPLFVLSRDELTELGKLFAPLPDPTVLVDVMEGALRDGDLSVLKNQAALASFTEYIASRNGQHAEPAASPAT